MSKTKPKRPRMADIAREANVNRITVSRALSRPDLVAEDTLKRINDAIAKVGYIPDQVARGLKSDRSRIVSLVTPPQMSGVYGAMLEQLALALHSGGLIVNLFPMLNDDTQRETALRELVGWRPAAVVLFGTQLNDAMRSTLNHSHSPVIDLLNYDETGPGACVGYDQTQASFQLAEHLIGRGYRTIAYAHSANPKSSMNAKRVEGFANAIRQGGGQFLALSEEGPEQLADKSGDLIGVELKTEPSFTAGYELMQQLHERGQVPDAMLFASDMVAVGALQFSVSHGLSVPEDVAICAFDGTELTSVVKPSLTSLDVPFERVVELGTREILRLTGEFATEVKKIRVETQVAHREST